ncbi:hypothetical protein ACWC4E_33755 [Streptomyces sp. NPDC001273]|uniref:hypothetical protein n=1 Tax=unclassified Streptomyces TaxID=2593676 RepID=UPI0034100C9B
MTRLTFRRHGDVLVLRAAVLLAAPRMTVTPAETAATAGHVIRKPESHIALTY